MKVSGSLLVAVTAIFSATADAWVVRGATGGVDPRTGARPFRQNIVGMQRTGGPVWDLYIQSLQMFQDQNQTDQLSYYAFSGVHGYPYGDWDGVRGLPNPHTPSYAPHNAMLFGPWHRVYLAAFEQLIQENARVVAGQYPAQVRQRYLDAANVLRIPYWDWASGAQMPPVLNDLGVSINTPFGVQSVRNPLAKYTFHPIPADFPPGALSRLPETQRTPDRNGRPQVVSMNQQLQANARSLSDRVYSLMARYTKYGAVSNTGFPVDQRDGLFDSIENIHNQIHGLVGGSGHMSFVPFSSYDPIFWLHHTNIDRLLAIWEAINPNSYVVPQRNDQGTYAIAAGTVEDINTPLLPFRSDDRGNFHTSAIARGTRNFAYAYPEVMDWGVSSQQLASNTRAQVIRLYNPTGALNNQRTDGPSMRIKRQDTTEDKRDWFINLKVNRTLEVPVAINFFLGAPPADSAEWQTASNLICSQMVLPFLAEAEVSPLALAQLPLTRSLAEASESGALNSTDVASINAFLKNQLQWNVLTATGDVMDPTQLTDLEISVLDQKVEINPAHDQFDSYGEINNHTSLSWSSNEPEGGA